ncbi:MAG: hypothetical protein AAF741_18010 [Bacteroidota bacterium]
MQRVLPFYFVLSTVLIFASACFTPEAVVRIHPERGENVFWHEGQPIAEQSKSDIMMRAAYSHATDDYLVFDIEVFNDRRSSVLISPEDLILTSPKSNIRIPARDPETVMLNMEIDASRKEANAKNAAVVSAVVMIGAAIAVASADNAAAEASGLADNLADDVIEATTFVTDIGAPIAASIAFRQNNPLSTPVEEIPHTDNYFFWQDVALRKTTLGFGESTRGLVAFPRNDTFDRFVLGAPIADVFFSFLFEQRLYKP